MNVSGNTQKFKKEPLSYHAEIMATSGPVILVLLHHIGAQGARDVGQLGISLAFPPPFFSVQAYGLYVADVRWGIFTYVSKHTTVYGKGE